MKKILITGTSGFAGSHLAQYLIQKGDSTVSGTYLTSSTHKNLENVQDKIELHQVDLVDYENTRQLIDKIRPDIIYHLAAFPSPAQSFKNPALFLTNNISAELNILEAVKEVGILDTKILIVSSAEIYGKVSEKDLPMNEETPLRPVSPYGVSKITQDFLGLQYFLTYKLQVLRIRPFGHLGPRLSPDFVVSAFSKKIAEIEKGIREPVLTVGNLTTRRDMTDVRDMVRAYDLLIEKGEVGEVYNAGRGESYVIRDVLDKLLSLSAVTVEVKEDPSLLRPNDIPELRCDNTKIEEKTGWKAEIPLDKSLEDTLNYWRDQV